MRKLYENFHIFHLQKRIVSPETIQGNTVDAFESKDAVSDGFLNLKSRNSIFFILTIAQKSLKLL